MRINGLKFPPTHSHDLSSKPPYANHTMYEVLIDIVTCISPPQFRKLKTVKRKGGHELTVDASLPSTPNQAAVQRPTCANSIRRMAVP